MKCKIAIFFWLFGFFFSKCSSLRLQNVTSPSIKHPINLTFSVVVFICKIYVFNGVTPCQIIQNFWIMSPLSHGFFWNFHQLQCHRDMKALKIFMVLLINDEMACLPWHFKYSFYFDKFCFKQPLVLKIHWGFLTQKTQRWFRNCPKTYR